MNVIIIRVACYDTCFRNNTVCNSSVDACRALPIYYVFTVFYVSVAEPKYITVYWSVLYNIIAELINVGAHLSAQVFLKEINAMK